jgi:tetratricopeptide (TPR) repeat protein
VRLSRALIHLALPGLLGLPALLGLAVGCNGEAPVHEQTYRTQKAQALALADRSKNQRDVLAALLEVHALREDDRAINHRLGRVYADMKLHELSLHHFDLAWRAQPDDAETLLSIVRLEIRLGMLAEAEEHVQPLLDDALFRGEGLYELAVVRDQQGRRDEALVLVADISGLSPEQAYRCASLHGRFLLEAGETDGARERFAASLVGRGDYKEALKGMADSLRRLGRTDEAARWDRILELIVELTDSVYMRSIQAAPQRIAVLKELNAIYPEWVDGYRRLAELNVKLGNAEQACAAIEAFLTNHPDVPAGQAAGLRARYCAGKRP